MARNDYKFETPTNVGAAQRTLGTPHQNDNMEAFSAVVTFTDAAPATKTFLDTAITTTGNYINIAAHGYKNGLIGTLTTTSALPTGLANNVNYYVIENDVGSIKLAISRAAALAGTAIALAKDGVGTHSFKPTALGTVDMHLAGSVDGITYYDIPSSTITASGTALWNNLGPIAFPYVRSELTITAGQVNHTMQIRSRGIV